jgi:uncharacterized protein GlcG (DUF336 family)
MPGDAAHCGGVVIKLHDEVIGAIGAAGAPTAPLK